MTRNRPDKVSVRTCLTTALMPAARVLSTTLSTCGATTSGLPVEKRTHTSPSGIAASSEGVTHFDAVHSLDVEHRIVDGIERRIASPLKCVLGAFAQGFVVLGAASPPVNGFSLTTPPSTPRGGVGMTVRLPDPRLPSGPASSATTGTVVFGVVGWKVITRLADGGTVFRVMVAPSSPKGLPAPGGDRCQVDLLALLAHMQQRADGDAGAHALAGCRGFLDQRRADDARRGNLEDAPARIGDANAASNGDVVPAGFLQPESDFALRRQRLAALDTKQRHDVVERRTLSVVDEGAPVGLVHLLVEQLELTRHRAHEGSRNAAGVEIGDPRRQVAEEVTHRQTRIVVREP
jgi:hypothetical protein